NRGAQIVGGTNSSTVLLRNGDLWSWGQGGLLGDGTTTSKGVPVPVLWNAAPEVTMTFPSGTNETPSLSRVTKPTLGWTQTDVIQTVFSHAQIQVLDEKGTVLLDSGEIEQNTTLSSGSWTTSEALPVNQKVQV
ncbi:hypothetical protein M3629_28270, partial [Paenibacillus polysaccharolyticus]|uniref:hypothetical protein n=1 Tax=Paenibacillus polysaccharolyticus TaxID=582692 RepID=UPI0020420DEB